MKNQYFLIKENLTKSIAHQQVYLSKKQKPKIGSILYSLPNCLSQKTYNPNWTLHTKLDFSLTTNKPCVKCQLLGRSRSVKIWQPLVNPWWIWLGHRAGNLHGFWRYHYMQYLDDFCSQFFPTNFVHFFFLIKSSWYSFKFQPAGLHSFINILYNIWATLVPNFSNQFCDFFF